MTTTTSRTKPTMDNIRDLTPDPRNRRKHNPRNVGMLVESLQAVGAARSIVIDEDGTVLAGNATLDAATQAGITNLQVVDVDGQTVVAVRRSGLSDAQKRALALYDNRVAELAEWNVEQLKLDAVAGLDLQPFWTEAERIKLLGTNARPGRTDPDAVPDSRATSIKTGDCFALGAHRLLCGDATNADDITGVLGGERAALCLTDPPYGIGEAYQSFDDTPDHLAALIGQFVPLVRRHAACVLLTPGNRHQRLYPPPDWTLCWFLAAGTGVNPWGFTCWHPVLAYGADPYLAKGLGSRPDGLAKTESAENALAHPCPKPVGVWAWFLERGSPTRGERVLDPFCGSGTTLIACEQLGRACRAVEIEPRYVQVAIDRWEAFTGSRAEKVGEVLQHGQAS